MMYCGLVVLLAIWGLWQPRVAVVAAAWKAQLCWHLERECSCLWALGNRWWLAQQSWLAWQQLPAAFQVGVGSVQLHVVQCYVVQTAQQQTSPQRVAQQIGVAQLMMASLLLYLVLWKIWYQPKGPV